MNASILSIQVGRTREYVDENGKAWSSAIAKDPVDAAVMVHKTAIEGDEQFDLKHHGGVDKAVLAYSGNHYESWRSEFPPFAERETMNGAFGENLTIIGQTEVDVCVGDLFAIGDVELEVSQPREPCWKLSSIWRLPKLAVRVQKTGRTGWYYRVIQEGRIEAGDAIKLIRRPFPEWTIQNANQVMYAKPRDSKADMQLSQCEALSDAWKKPLHRRATK